MKVVLVYRKQKKGAYSIESLFNVIGERLAKHIEIIKYEVGNRSQTLLDAWRLRQLGADIYHVTGDVNYMVYFLPYKKTILTVHDIGHYLFGLSGIKRWLYKWFWLILPIRCARYVTAVSKETHDNMVKHLDIKDKKITVIENCHGTIFKPVVKTFTKECPVILQVGTQPYKNVPRLIEALSGLRCHLVLIGKLDDLIKKKLGHYKISYENHVNLGNEEVYKKYLECDFVSFISLGEGFGVPIIEAQAVGRPLITASLSPMCDVAGKGACLVDPFNVQQISEGIQKIIDDSAYRKELIENGYNNITRYTPETISNKYLELYKRLMLA